MELTKIKIRLVYLASFVVGLVISVVATNATYKTVNFVSSAETVVGEVVRMYGSDTLGAVVSYQVSGQLYEVRSGSQSSPPSYRVGEAVEVLYDPADPEVARINTLMELYLLPVLFIPIGLLLMWPLLRQYRRARLVSRLQRSGERVQADVTEILKQNIGKRKGRSCYKIIAQYLDPRSNQMKVFASEDIWFDPTEYVGETIAVLIDLADVDKYYVDTTFLPDEK